MRVIKSPLYIDMGVRKVKRYYLNMNGYRNWHFQISNNLKKKYKELIKDQVKDLKLRRVGIDYQLYYKDKRKRDKMNIVCVVSKFFLDALVEYGCIDDDNDEFIGEERILTPKIDKENPRCEIILKYEL